MQINLTSGGYLPKGLNTFFVVRDYRNSYTVYGRFTSYSEAAACAFQHRSHFFPDPVTDQMHMVGG